jgi:inward rectifier potassium channel
MSKDLPPQNISTFASAFRDRREVTVRPLGVRRMIGSDAYHRLMKLRWRWLITLFALVFLVFNLAFAGLYWLDPAGLAVATGADAETSPFWRDFFFSVATVATIGYGNIYPVSIYTQTMVVIEITLGIIYFALTTGIAFARFSRPTARILFSDVLAVRTVDGVPMLMLRAANQRHNLIFEAQVRLSLIRDDTFGGVSMRRFHDLLLVRDTNPVFALTWTVLHPIDLDSPLRELVEDPEAGKDMEIIVILSGVDEISGQPIHARWAYTPREIRWNVRFADILGIDKQGIRTIDYSRFHNVEATPEFGKKVPSLLG